MADSFSIWILWTMLAFLTMELQKYGISGCIEEERIGLLKLKAAFNNHSDASALSSWREGGSDCCNWENVECDLNHRRVLRLHLNSTRGYSLSYWSLNLSLFSPFKELKYLNLADNLLRGFKGELRSNKLQILDLAANLLSEIPPFSSREIQYLDVSLNQLNKTPSISSSKLQYLDLSSNQLTFNLSSFKDFTALTALEVLNIGNNLITGEIPTSIGALTNLRVLSFSFNKLSGSIPQEALCRLRNLKELDLSKNSLTGVIPSCLSNLTSLKFLELSENSLVGNIPSNLFPSLKSLEWVSLSYNRFEGLFSFSSLSSNSKLEVFKLDSHNNQLVVDTENPCWTPPFQLKVLSLSNCKLNEPTGSIPSFLLNQYDLRFVNLSHNNIPGELPSWILRNNTNLEFLILSHNLLTGPFFLHPDIRSQNIYWLDVSSNQIQEELPNFIGSALPNLHFLNMSLNMFHGSVPPSLGDMKELESLDLSNNKLFGEIPEQLVTGCVSLSILKLSSNSLVGPLLPAKLNFTKLRCLYLDDNKFSGELPISLLGSLNLQLLDISNNSLSGEMPFWLGNFSELITLVMSDNSFESSIPSSFCKLKQLSFVDLSRNKFCGSIPSCANLTSLKYLHLQGNNFTGPLPRTLSGSSSLVTLDIRENKLSGELPDWVSSLSSLRALLLKKNDLNGSIPSELCHLRNMSLLDLSCNKFTGPVPSCLNQIPFGSKRLTEDVFARQSFGWKAYMPFSTYSYETELSPFLMLSAGFYTSDVEEEIEFMSKSRFENYRGSILYYMSGVDLSQNELTGHIPEELGYLSDIHTLNLSHNHLTGSIPRTLSNLKAIQSMDLSFNKLSGHIPPELTQLTFLSVFSVAHNNLSGRTPDRVGQFGTFDESSYEGNPLLHVPPLERNQTRSRQWASHESGEEDSFIQYFVKAFFVSYFPALVGTVSFMYIMASCRERKRAKARRNAYLRRMP